MRATIGALLTQVVDYAGLFPPAKLPLDAALNQYLRERKSSPHRWMLGRFVCPTAQLKPLATLAKEHADGPLLQIAALGKQADKSGDLLEQVRSDIELIADFRAGWGSDAVIDVMELQLPKEATIAHLQSQLANVPEEFAEAGLIGFLEVPMSPTWTDDSADLCRALEEMHRTQPHATVGMKLRCGGLTAAAFPSDAQVAGFIARCSTAKLPWKATAGLHHPRRHWDETLKVWHHGFLNVFVAGVLARIHALTVADIVEILADRAGEGFRFEDDRLGWRDWSATAGQIAEARGHAATAFGSCSFDEPCIDLTAMGLLDGIHP